MKTNGNENQHWVPKFLIKNFSDTDGRVFCLDVQTDTVTKRPPKFAASAAAFNEFIIDGAEISYEDKLERIETAAAPALKHIVRSGTLVGLAQKQRERLSQFMAAQSFRTLAFYKGLGLPIAREEFGKIFYHLWRSAEFTADHLLRRNWALMTIEHDDVFYLGDHPLVLQHSDRTRRGPEVGFDIEGVEALMPLSPKHALYMPCAATCERILSGYVQAEKTPQNIAIAKALGVNMQSEINQLKEVAERILRSHRPLYEALTIGKALVVTDANVENLNYLQCAWAHTAVYSNRGDFTFAKHVFKNTPQYRNVLKARLAQAGRQS